MHAGNDALMAFSKAERKLTAKILFSAKDIDRTVGPINSFSSFV